MYYTVPYIIISNLKSFSVNSAEFRKLLRASFNPTETYLVD